MANQLKETSENASVPPAPDSRYDFQFDINDNASEYVAQLQRDLGSSQPVKDVSGVTIKPAPHDANSFSLQSQETKSADTILNELQPGDDTRAQLIQISFQDGAAATFVPLSNGFVHTAVEAYNQHRHLKIRPEDIWLAILTQLSNYINAHAEELRDSFVAHEGKKSLKITYDGETRFSVDWADFSYKIGTMIQDNVVDPELREWIMPAFSTTESHDVVVASIVMMATMQKYFSYGCATICGIPSVTLLGEKADYELILRRLEKLRSYGKEPNIWVDLLTPVLKRFIRSFEEPEADDVLDFWNRIFSRYNMGSGADEWSGWLNAFMFWDDDGKMLYREQRDDAVDDNLFGFDSHFDFGDGITNHTTSEESVPSGRWTLDGVIYHTISEESVPSGYCTVPVHIDDNGVEIEAEMVAGSVGWEWSSSGGEIATSGDTHWDTVQARSGWFIYEKLPQAEMDAKRKVESERREVEFEMRMVENGYL